MRVEHPERLSLRELATRIEDGSIDPVELAEFYLHRIENDPDRETVFTLVMDDYAMDAARGSLERAQKGERRSLFDGIPLVWKDNFNIAGFPTSVGVPLLAQSVAERNAVAYQTAEDAGFVCLGKATMTDLAFSGLGINGAYGTPPNTFDRARVPGGSSSGCGVAVAKNLCCAAVGTDTGGSVRIPAAWNGLVGLRPTGGRISLEGVAPLSQSLDTVGFLARRVDDTRALYEVFCGTERGAETNVALRDLRFLIPSNYAWKKNHPDVEEVIKRLLVQLASAGAEILEGKVEEFDDLTALFARGGNIVNFEGNKNWRSFLDAHPEAVYDRVRDRFDLGAQMQEEKIRLVYEGIKELRERLATSMKQCDVILIPTTPNVPPRIEEVTLDREAYGRENRLALQNTKLANYLGLCAITVPCGVTDGGLPVGLMLFGPSYGESALLDIAEAVSMVI